MRYFNQYGVWEHDVPRLLATLCSMLVNMFRSPDKPPIEVWQFLPYLKDEEEIKRRNRAAKLALVTTMPTKD